MYFENSDQCELTVRYHLTQVQAEAWGKVVETLHALTAVDGYGFYETKASDFEDTLIEVLAETVYELTEEERPESDDWRGEAENAYVDMYKDRGLFDVA